MGEGGGGRRRRRLELARVGVVGGVLELAVRAQVVGARVGGAAQRALEAAGEVHVVVVADVRHHLAAELAAVQVQRARHALERQPHVPALRACNQKPVSRSRYVRTPHERASPGIYQDPALFSRLSLRGLSSELSDMSLSCVIACLR